MTSPENINAARLVLQSLGLDAQDLIDAPDAASTTVTLRE